MIFYFFLLLFLQTTIFCGRPQYYYYNYDAHPWTYGQDVKSSHARQMCARMDKRLCTSNDIDVFARQERHHCRSAQALNSATLKVYGHISRSKHEQCIKSMIKYVGVYPQSVYPSDITLNIFYCLTKSNTKFECSGNGEDYKGYKFTTKSGKVCQNWVFQMPNKHGYTPAKNPEKNIQKNYCRNPDQSESPWCYLSKEVGRESCGIECANYGKFERCEAIFFEKANFTGANCSFKLDKPAEEILTDIRGDSKSTGCKDTNLKNKVGSQRVIGKQCSAKVFYASDKFVHVVGDFNKSEEIAYQKKFYKVFLFDQSPDVILGSPTQFYASPATSDYHVCTLDEVDNAAYPVYKSDYSTGLTLIDGLLVVYSRGDETNFVPGKKFTQCCLNEFPIKGTQAVEKQQAEAHCNTKNRYITGTRRGVAIPGSHNKRLCTAADLKAYFINAGQKFDMGWAAQSGKNDIKVVYGTLAPHRDVIVYQPEPKYAVPQCCDKDCLPFMSSCVTNETCCTRLCVNQFCQSPHLKETPKPRRYEPKNSQLTRQLIFLGSLYTLGQVLRCCCPKKHPKEFHPHID